MSRPSPRRGQRLDHPAPHGLHVFDETLPLGRPPDHRGERVDVLPAELMSPAAGRAFSSAWNSQVLAQRS